MLQQAPLEDVKPDGTSYTRLQPKPQTVPSMGIQTPRLPVAATSFTGDVQALPIQERGKTPVAASTLTGGGPMVQPPAPGTRNPALPPKPGVSTLPEDQITPGSSGPDGGQPQPPPGPPPIPPPVGQAGGPMVNPPAPGVTPPGGPNIIPPPPGTTPAGGGGSVPVSLNQFSPGADLRNTAITPGTDPRLASTQGQVDTARDALSTGPDRAALAAQNFQLLRDSTQPQYDAAVRQVGANAAKFGRIGAGMTTNELTSLDQSRERDLLQAQKGLSLDAAGSTLADRQAILSSLGGLEGQQYGEGASGRNELRGERGYQTDFAQQGLTNEQNRLGLEDTLTNSEFGRNQERARTLAAIGGSSDPTAALGGQADYYGGQAGASGQSVAELLANAAYQRGTTAAPAPTAPRPPAPAPAAPYYEDPYLTGPGAVR